MLFCSVLFCMHIRIRHGLYNRKAVLSQAEPRDAAVNFDITIYKRHRAVSVPQHRARLSCWSLSADCRQCWTSL